jgi:hypothetical protein
MAGNHGSDDVRCSRNALALSSAAATPLDSKLSCCRTWLVRRAHVSDKQWVTLDGGRAELSRGPAAQQARSGSPPR